MLAGHFENAEEDCATARLGDLVPTLDDVIRCKIAAMENLSQASSRVVVVARIGMGLGCPEVDGALRACHGRVDSH